MNDSITLDDFRQKSYERYGKFWERLVAAVIDGLLMQAVGVVLGFLGIGMSLSDSIAMQTNPEAGLDNLTGMGMAIGTSMMIQWLYFAYMESSERQATLGKMAMGLRVVDVSGERVSFLQATGRHFGKIISGIILLIGYLIQPFTEKKQTLHDIMAGTLVVK